MSNGIDTLKTSSGGREYTDIPVQTKEEVLKALSEAFGTQFGYADDPEGTRSGYTVMDSLLSLRDVPETFFKLFSGEEMIEATSPGGVRHKKAPFLTPGPEHAWYNKASNMLNVTDVNSILAELSHHYQYYNPDWVKPRSSYKDYPWLGDISVPPYEGAQGVTPGMLDDLGMIPLWRLNYRMPGAFEYEAHSTIQPILEALFTKLGLGHQFREQNIQNTLNILEQDKQKKNK